MTEDEHRGWYAALKSKDARFDGRFFVGVSSTGIYCRPVCRARLPKEENCTFYSTAAEAEQAGYRPCLICRPELAPGRSITDAKSSLVRRATRLLEENCGSGLSLDTLAGRLGCTDRHLRRVFGEEYGVTPVQYVQTMRLLLAKSLLTDTNLSATEVAMTAGFGSLRRFNDLFKKHYRMSPTALRKQTINNRRHEEIRLSLGYRPPYRWNEMLNFFAGRAISGVEVVRDDAYYRTAHFISSKSEHLRGWIKVGNNEKKNALSLSLSPNLLTVLPQILARVRHLFDLYCVPDVVAEALQSMNNLNSGLFKEGIRVPGCFDAFEMCVRTVLGQQITVKAAGTLAARLAKALGEPLAEPLCEPRAEPLCEPRAEPLEVDGLTHTFPTPEALLALGNELENRLGSLGIISARARTIRELARTFVDGSIDYSSSAHPEKEMEKLLALPGIGNWSAHYIAMRAMGWPDAFLETDYGVKKALEPYLESTAPRQVRELSESWRPWRSYATVALWNSLAHS
ncbi:MAG: helix-turn-helix domain-containing protein [Coriobacteriales bacterium]|jgi:AraC family transcriptional regulator of adaptative response / DNA-3-methyladenine glycosylase II|nr:helix-turn-helix domain-containing protein [Coriobacteriales bacterium]